MCETYIKSAHIIIIIHFISKRGHFTETDGKKMSERLNQTKWDRVGRSEENQRDVCCSWSTNTN